MTKSQNIGSLAQQNGFGPSFFFLHGCVDGECFAQQSLTTPAKEKECNKL
jgi:hypothetical protein